MLTSFAIRNALTLFGTLVSSRLSILIFHRVLSEHDPLCPDEPDAVRFDKLMRHVSSSYRVLTLGEAITRLEQDNLPPRSLVITFDDGYADNAEVALPILQRYGLKATFFIASGFLDGGRMWNDSVIECVRACHSFEIDLDEFGLGRATLNNFSAKKKCFDALLQHIKYQSMDERERSISRLQHLCGIDKLPHNLMMRSDQVRQLHRAGMEIGGHTVNHPILLNLDPAEAENEVAQGRNDLQSITDSPVDVFAFPNGKPNVDYDYSHVEMLRKLGFRGSVSTAPGVGQSGDDLFQLPRFTPWNQSVPAWSVRLLHNQINHAFDKAVNPRLAFFQSSTRAST
jgi:peptidoglycan/xylan/chitin deacetylase (PgdA/CDA1 family)